MTAAHHASATPVAEEPKAAGAVVANVPLRRGHLSPRKARRLLEELRDRTTAARPTMVPNRNRRVT
eukprot:15178610-Alexandrium_andersonii.AAC.1